MMNVVHLKLQFFEDENSPRWKLLVPSGAMHLWVVHVSIQPEVEQLVFILSNVVPQK